MLEMKDTCIKEDLRNKRKLDQRKTFPKLKEKKITLHLIQSQNRCRNQIDENYTNNNITSPGSNQ